ncbi:LytTR family DNA-binding domain-containing protein [Phenylobacterium sp.]|uniref:LytTR family DNA-binding domain-containing protein n=1 Tax=Phenylobacterium sp. TaxID=1871053 RepID=UPI003564FE6E
MPPVARTVYWCGLLLAGTLWAQVALGLIKRALWLAQRPWLSAAILVGLLTLPGMLLVWTVTAAAFGHPLRLRSLEGLAGSVFALSVVMTAINALADRRTGAGRRRVRRAAVQSAAPPKFLDRLPPRLRGAELLALEADDHFLRIHTDRGSGLILMRLCDAVAELDGAEGTQTHRSWWVARRAVVGVTRGGGRACFTLKDGVKAPVSRTYAPALRREGWY